MHVVFGWRGIEGSDFKDVRPALTFAKQGSSSQLNGSLLLCM
jgi:hypothetical protein